MTKRERWLQVAHTWIGVPWRKAGSRREGVNCLGLLVGIAKECEFEMDIAARELDASLTSSPIPGFMLKRAKEDLDIIHLRDAIPGDLLLIRIQQEPQHIAIISGVNPLFILHTDPYAKKVHITPMLPGWHPAVAFRIRDLDE